MSDEPTLETFSESSPLNELTDETTIDEFLDRINEDLVAGMPERIHAPGRLETLTAMYRAQAEKWVQDQKDKPARGTKSADAKKAFAEAIQGTLGIEIKL